MAWLVGTPARRVSSFGSLSFFCPENAPAGAPERCTDDCPAEPTCVFSARRQFLAPGRPDIPWHLYTGMSLEAAWDVLTNPRLRSLASVIAPDGDRASVLRLLRETDHGRCVYRAENDVVDHQSVIIDFYDSCVATHTMVGGASRPCRTIHLVGSEGEIEGNMEEGHFVVRHPDARAGHEYVETRVDIDVSGHMHGGGDFRLVRDFVSALCGEPASISLTSIEDSIYGHLIAYAADQAMREHRVVEIEDIS